MSSLARVVTLLTKDDFVFQNPSGDSGLAGLCVDLWNETAKTLNLTSTFTIVNSMPEVFKNFRENRSDVIMQAVDHAAMEFETRPS